MAYNKTPFKMMGKSPMMKALVGKQGNLPMHLQEKIKAAPESPAKMYKKSPVKQMKQESAGTTDAMRKKVRQESTGATDALTGKKAARKARKDRKQEELKKAIKNDTPISPAKKYKSAAQRKAVHASKADGGKGAPAKMYKKSPVKQTDTKIKDIPEVLENTGKKVIEKGKKIIKSIGEITLSSKERKACKKKGGRFKKGKCYMPESPITKSNCGYKK
jgi:hypothetical protein